jgi:hypothetical protein
MQGRGWRIPTLAPEKRRMDGSAIYFALGLKTGLLINGIFHPPWLELVA